MPCVSEFFGIYYDDVGQHSLPHFHATYAEHRAVYSIPGGDLIAGSLPKRQTRLVQARAELRTRQLERAWGRAVQSEPPGTIPPIR